MLKSFSANIGSNMEQYYARILTKLSSKKYMSNAELIDWIYEQIKIPERTSQRILKDLESQGFITKKDVKGFGHKQYTINTRDKETSHRLYMIVKKGHQLYSQKKISRIIHLNEKMFDKTFHENPDEMFSEAGSTLLSLLYWHNKLTFAITTGWLGHSKIEHHLANENRKRIEKLIKKITTNVNIHDFEIWHTLAHAVHDIIEDNRILSRKQLERIWKLD